MREDQILQNAPDWFPMEAMVAAFSLVIAIAVEYAFARRKKDREQMPDSDNFRRVPDSRGCGSTVTPCIYVYYLS